MSLPHCNTIAPSIAYIIDEKFVLSWRMLKFAILLRFILLCFSIWQDTTKWPDGQLRFTDIDYDVFTDSARAMVLGNDIYEARPTYRYSPLIAMLLTPGYYLNNAWSSHLSDNKILLLLQVFERIGGKIVFITSDILCAILQFHIMILESKKYPHPTRQESLSLTYNILIGICWLFNPITVAVSVRGNAESVVGLSVLLCLYFLLRNRCILSGLFFGLSIHLKLYPIIYSAIIYLILCELHLQKVLDSTQNGAESIFYRRAIVLVRVICIPNFKHWIFALATTFTGIGLTAFCYYCYGWSFLHSAYLYHFNRVDFWHNFASHFYPIYLFEGSIALALENRTLFDSEMFPLNIFPASILAWFYSLAVLQYAYSFFKCLILLPGLILIPTLSYRFRRHPSFSFFAITFAFVAFNKVCTSQYFLWWLVLLPPALAHFDWSICSKGQGSLHSCFKSLGINSNIFVKLSGLLVMWLISQACWLLFAYLHEIQGTLWNRYLWLCLWLSSIAFLMVNVYILCKLNDSLHLIDKENSSKKKFCSSVVEAKMPNFSAESEKKDSEIRKENTYSSYFLRKRTPNIE